jgi:hypothetical protein
MRRKSFLTYWLLIGVTVVAISAYATHRYSAGAIQSESLDSAGRVMGQAGLPVWGSRAPAFIQ